MTTSRYRSEATSTIHLRPTDVQDRPTVAKGSGCRQKDLCCRGVVARPQTTIDCRRRQKGGAGRLPTMERIDRVGVRHINSVYNNRSTASCILSVLRLCNKRQESLVEKYTRAWVEFELFCVTVKPKNSMFQCPATAVP